MEGYVVYNQGMWGFSENHQYSICESVANKHYHQLIKKLKDELDVINLDDCPSGLGYDNNLVEEELGDIDDEAGVIRRFRIIHEVVSSDEYATEYDEEVEWVVMKKIEIEE